MDKKELLIDYAVYENLCPEAYRELYAAALKVLPDAYSVYSGFSVGAAVLLEDGNIITGTNQENVAYPSGLCAERTALFYAASRYPSTSIRAIAIVAMENGMQTNLPVSPCGACRQVMAELVKRFGDFDVLMGGREKCLCIKASGLLPFAFGME